MLAKIYYYLGEICLHFGCYSLYTYFMLKSVDLDVDEKAWEKHD